MTTSTSTKDRATKAYHSLQEQLDESPLSAFMAWLVMAVLLALLLKVIYVNIAPFVIVIGGSIPPASNIPIIGWLWDVLNLLYVGTGAVLAWTLINVCEVAWIFVAMDRKAHRSAIRESRKELARQEAEGLKDDRQTRKMRRRSVRLPFFFIAASGWIALAAFIVDAIINWNAYPLCKSFPDFLAGLTIGDLSPINWGNAGIQIWNLFSMEILVVAIVACGQWIWMHKADDQTP
jgi:hypothetical protein